MTDCPSPDDFARLLANSRDEIAWGKLERHLASCYDCRQRLDTLAGVESILTGGASKWRAQASTSNPLRKVIEQLRDSSSGEGARTQSPRKTIQSLAFLQPTDEPGFIGQFGDYPVRRVIGQGGMGIVLEALDPVLRRTVAIKMLSPWRVLDDETKERFLREAQAAASLTHENLVAIHAVAQYQGEPFLVLEYISGESLQERLQRQGKLPLDELVRLGIEVARGLAAAHAKGLVHRDIKPANILLVEGTSRAKIADFGLAKTASQDAITLDGTLLGTPEFMSPEQASGMEAGPASDLFSLGAVLYVAATGISPFRHESLLGTLENVRLCQPPPLQEMDASLPDWFRDLIQRLLAKEPRQRPSSAGEVAELLERRAAPESVAVLPARQSTSPGIGDAIAQGFKRRWRLIVLLAAVAAVLIVVWGVWFRGGPHAELPPKKHPEKPAIQAGFTIFGREQVFEHLAAALATAEDRDVIEVHGRGAYLTPPLTIEGKRLTIRAAAGSHPKFLTETPGSRVQQPFVLSDSDLRLEGLEIHWTIEGPPEFSEGIILAHSIVASTHGRLMVAHCRIVSERFNCCVGASCRDVLVRDSHLVAKNGIGVFWRPEAGGKLEIEGSALENRFGVTLLMDGVASGTPGQFHLSRSTVAAERTLQLVMENRTPKQPLPFFADRNVIDSEHLFQLMRPSPPRMKVASKPDDLPVLLRTWVAWSEENNVYRRGAKYISRAAPAQQGSTVSADIQGVERWLEMWKLPAGKSIEGEIRFKVRPGSSDASPLVLDSVNNPSGPRPIDAGALAERLGPGPAYHAWRSSPEYAKWPPPANAK